MSWSAYIIGKPEKVIENLESGLGFTGESLKEFEEARPHIIGLIKQNFETAEAPKVFIKLEASGHGTSCNGEPKSRSCTVNVTPVYNILV